MSGRTTLLIAHRRSTVETAGRVLVLADGRIETTGTVEQLSRNSASYRQLFEPAQSAGPG